MKSVSSINNLEKNVPKLRFPGFEGEWEEKRLSHVTSYLKIRDQASKSQFVSTENMKQNCLGIEPYTENNFVEGIAFDKGDILIANIRPYLKKAWLATFSGVCSTDVLAIHPMNVDSAFIYSAICRDNFFTYVMSGVKGSKMPRGDKSQIMDFSLGVPCIEEQKKIAEFIQYLNKRIEKQQQLVEALKSYKRGVLKHIFNGYSVKLWHTVRLGEICSITMGQSPDSAFYNFDKKGMPLVQGNADITDGITTPQRYTTAPIKTCEAGSVILSVRAPVGSVSRANQNICLGRGVCAITSQNTEFIYQLLIYYQDAWKRIEQGGTFSAISSDDISSFSFSIPNIETQNRISSLLSKYDINVRREEVILRLLHKQKAGLLHSLFI